MKTPTLQVKMGGKTVTVPVIKNEETTRRIVERVNQRLQDIEENSPRIDTQAFALQTAFSFAADLLQAEAAEAEDQQDTLDALGRLQQSLESVLTVMDFNPD